MKDVVKNKAIKTPPPPRLLTVDSAKRFTALCLSALLTVGFMPTAALADNASLSGEQPAEYFLDDSDQIDSTMADSEQTSGPTDAKDEPLASDTEESTEEVVDPIDPTTPIQDETVSEPEYTEPDEPSEPVQNEVESFINDDTSSDIALESPPPQKFLATMILFP